MVKVVSICFFIWWWMSVNFLALECLQPRAALGRRSRGLMGQLLQTLRGRIWPLKPWEHLPSSPLLPRGAPWISGVHLHEWRKSGFCHLLRHGPCLLPLGVPCHVGAGGEPAHPLPSPLLLSQAEHGPCTAWLEQDRNFPCPQDSRDRTAVVDGERENGVGGRGHFSGHGGEGSEEFLLSSGLSKISGCCSYDMVSPATLWWGEGSRLAARVQPPLQHLLLLCNPLCKILDLPWGGGDR